jgi:outer membrane protein assembly factor BamA
MITAKDLEAIEKIKAYIAEQGYISPKVDVSSMNREDVFITISFHKRSAQKPEGEKESC